LKTSSHALGSNAGTTSKNLRKRNINARIHVGAQIAPSSFDNSLCVPLTIHRVSCTPPPHSSRAPPQTHAQQRRYRRHPWPTNDLAARRHHPVIIPRQGTGGAEAWRAAVRRPAVCSSSNRIQDVKAVR